MTINNINIHEEQLKEICKRYLIEELTIFGSALRDDFNDSSDVDLLYTFQDTARHSLFDVEGIKEEEKFSKVIELDEMAKNDYNLSPTRYIYTAEEETYRPIGEILEDLEQEAKEIDKELKDIFQKLGY